MVWRDIPGYEGLYQVSDCGDVRSLDRVSTGNRNRRLKGKTLKRHFTTTGYYMVSLCKDGRSKCFGVHRLVALAFIDNPENKPYINHIDCDPLNNCVDNLEWCTPKENLQYASSLGRCHGNGLGPRVITDEMIDIAISNHIPYDREYSFNAIAKRIGVNPVSLRSAVYTRGRANNAID